MDKKYEEYHPNFQLGHTIGQGIGWLGFWIMIGMGFISLAIVEVFKCT